MRWWVRGWLPGWLRGRLRRAVGRRERVVPVVPPAGRRRWERAAPDDWASRLHLLYLRHRDRVQPAYFARSGDYRMPRRGLPRVWRWYALDVGLGSVRLLWRTGRAVRAAVGVPLRRQAWQLWRLSVSLPARPEHYYTFEWYRPERRARAGEYLHRYETKGGLYAMLASRPDLEAVAPLTDKVGFAGHAARAGLPVVPTLAVVRPGQPPAGVRLPGADLFVKPAGGRGGRGAQKWSYLAGSDSFRASSAGAPAELPRTVLLDRLASAGAAVPWLVQPCLVNHPELADLALDAAATCRVVTILDEAGDPEPVVAIFRMPAVPGAVVDNLHRGGIAAPVEIGTGRLGPATGYAVAGPPTRFAHHPVTGAVITGRALPQWSAVLALAVRAHRAFAPRVLVGWDISVGPDGPVLVEGNEQPGVDGLQRLHDRPLGSHRFGELLAWHLAARFPEGGRDGGRVGAGRDGDRPDGAPPGAIMRR
jgi:hypothetical protein